MGELNVSVGDKVLYNYSNGRKHVEAIVTVTKVTPSGRISIDWCDTKFNKFGERIGGDAWNYSCLSIPTEEDYERIKKNSIVKKALLIIDRINKDNLSYEQALKIIDIFEEK